jgi:outer membrane murein-binding lipoprotein Lpp
MTQQENDLSTQIHQLREHVRKVLLECVQLRRDLLAAKEENDQLKAVISEQHQQINDFQYQFNFSKIVQNLANGGQDPALWKARIDECIKDLDHCIAYLRKGI